MEILSLLQDQPADFRITVGFTPQWLRENRTAVLMAGNTQSTFGINHTRRFACSIVADDLELEAPGQFVIADDFQTFGLLLVTDEEPILKQGTLRSR